MSRRRVADRYRFAPRFDILEQRALPSTTPYFDTILADNPEIYLHLNETSGPTAVDASGNANHGVYSGGVTFGQPGALLHGNDPGASFNGQQTGHALFGNPISGSFTVEAWIKTSVDSRTGTQGFHGNAIVWSDLAFVHDDWIVAVLNNHVSFFTGNPDVTIEGTTDLTDGLWHHIVATRVQGGATGIYVDGQLEASGTTNNSLLNDRPEIAVGGNSLDTRSFNGDLDEVALYNYALTPAQVMQHYLAGLNVLPIAVDDDVSTNEGTSVVIHPLANDLDPGDTLSLGQVDQPANGTVVVDDNNTPGDATDDFLVYTPDPGFFGPDSFGYQVVDSFGGSDTATVFVDVDPVTPAVDAGADESIEEGDAIARSGSFADPGADTWTATVDYGDGAGPQELVLAADKTFELEHQYTDNGTFTVTVTVTDDDLHVGTDTFVVTVNNVAPEAELVGPDFGVRGQPRRFTVSASDVGSEDDAAGFEYEIDWGDGSPIRTIERSEGNGDGVRVRHIFREAGVYTIDVVAIDKDNGESTTFSHTVHISAIGLQDDPRRPGRKILVVGGTTGNDRIKIRPGRRGKTVVIVNDERFVTFVKPSRAVVFTQGGRDRIHVSGPLRKSTTIISPPPRFVFNNPFSNPGRWNGALNALFSSIGNVIAKTNEIHDAWFANFR